MMEISAAELQNGEESDSNKPQVIFFFGCNFQVLKFSNFTCKGLIFGFIFWVHQEKAVVL